MRLIALLLCGWASTAAATPIGYFSLGATNFFGGQLSNGTDRASTSGGCCQSGTTTATIPGATASVTVGFDVLTNPTADAFEAILDWSFTTSLSVSAGAAPAHVDSFMTITESDLAFELFEWAVYTGTFKLITIDRTTRYSSGDILAPGWYVGWPAAGPYGPYDSGMEMTARHSLDALPNQTKTISESWVNTFRVVSVPEPSALLLLSLGLVPLLVRRRRAAR
jgi:hypothetical protein